MIFSFSAVVLFSVAACFVRFSQLLKYTDSRTGYVTDGKTLVILMYSLIAAAFAFAALYSFLSRRRARKLAFYSDNAVFVSLLLVAIGFFADFVHQCLNCFSYASTSSQNGYFEYYYFIALCILALSAVASCFYALVCAASVKNPYVDFKRFSLMHFAPFLWSFSKLFIIMTEMLDISAGIDEFLEFLFIACCCIFILSCLNTVASEKKQISPASGFFALCLFCISVSAALPRLLCALSGRYMLLGKVSFTSFTYAVLGLFALVCELNVFITGGSEKQS